MALGCPFIFLTVPKLVACLQLYYCMLQSCSLVFSLPPGTRDLSLQLYSTELPPAPAQDDLQVSLGLGGVAASRT